MSADVREALGLPPIDPAIEKRFGAPLYTEEQVRAYAKAVQTGHTADRQPEPRDTDESSLARVVEALRPIGWQDIRLCAGEGTLSAATVFQAMNAILKRRSEALSLLSPEGGGKETAWQPIESAPRDGTCIVLCTASRRAFVGYFGEQVEGDDGPCWAWAAAEEDVHPPCWTDGICWASNADDEPSSPPTYWIPLPAPPSSLPQPPVGEQ